MAVLVTNHVTAAGGPGRTAGGGHVKPALGEQWRPQPHQRVMLAFADARGAASLQRVATLTASPLQACGTSVELALPA